MHNVTETFHAEAFSDTRDVSTRAVFNETAVATGIEVDGDHLQEITVEEVISTDGLTIGSTCSNKATIKMYMPEEAIPLTDGWADLYVGIPSECPLGRFYIADVVTKDKYKTVTIAAYDKMSQLTQIYTPVNVTSFPAKIAAVVGDIAKQNGFEVDYDSFPDYEIPLIEATEREMLGYCAGLMGKNAKFNRDGKLTFVWFVDTDRDIPLDVQYQDGFSETTADSFVLGGLISGTEENPLTAGNGRTITFSNPFMTQDILESILSEVQGFTYTPCEVRYRCDPSFETGDIVDVVDDDSDVNAVHPVPIMAQKIKVGGGLNATIYAYGMSENSEKLMAAPSKGEIKRVKNELEKYMQELTDNIVGKNGGHYSITYDDNGFPTGWTIMDTPTLTAETKMWVMSQGGLGFSRDGGKNISKLAFDMDGNFYADCIMSGSITADKINVADLFAKEIKATGSITGLKFLSSGKDSYNYPSNMTLDGGCLNLTSVDGNVTFNTNIAGHDVLLEYLEKTPDDTARNFVLMNGNGIRHAVSRDSSNYTTIFRTTENGVEVSSLDVYGDLMVGGVNVLPYIVAAFRELKELIQAGNTGSAIAVLDKAILDLSVLA